MIVDASVHVWSADRLRYPFSPIDGVDTPEDDASTARLLGDLDAAGVAGAVLVQPRSYGYDHSYLVSALREHPGRLAGIGLVDPDSTRAGNDVANLHPQGIAGLRLVSVGGSDGLSGAQLPALLRAAAERSMSVSLLVTPDRLRRVDELARSYPEVTFIVDHYGLCTSQTAPSEVQTLIALAKASNVLVRVSAFTALSSAGYPFNDLMPLTRALYAAFGAQRLLWGTDYPYVLDSGSYVQSLDALRFHMPFIDAADLPLILGGNAARLFHLVPGRTEKP